MHAGEVPAVHHRAEHQRDVLQEDIGNVAADLEQQARLLRREKDGQHHDEQAQGVQPRVARHIVAQDDRHDGEHQADEQHRQRRDQPGHRLHDDVALHQLRAPREHLRPAGGVLAIGRGQLNRERPPGASLRQRQAVPVAGRRLQQLLPGRHVEAENLHIVQSDAHLLIDGEEAQRLRRIKRLRQLRGHPQRDALSVPGGLTDRPALKRLQLIRIAPVLQCGGEDVHRHQHADERQRQQLYEVLALLLRHVPTAPAS